MAKVAVEMEETYGWTIFDEAAYSSTIEIPEELYRNWLKARDRLETLEDQIITIANDQRGDDY